MAAAPGFLSSATMPARYPVGKLPPDLLQELLDRHVLPPAGGLLVGPAVGEDAAAVVLDGECLVAATDPVSFATDAIGHYVVHINANDVATMGAAPRWFLVALLLPSAADEPLVEQIFADVARACRQVGATWCGGHTEITAGLDRPVAVGTMLGTVSRRHLRRTADARPGDLIWCTKDVPLEATSLMARERPAWARKQVGKEAWQRCRDLLFDPGISVVTEALAAARAGAGCLHDPTEGGLATGLREMARAAGVGVEVEAEAIPLHPEGSRLCAAAGIDPLGALASGSLLVTASPDAAPAVEDALAGVGVKHRRIGRVTAAGLVLRRGGEPAALPEFPVDEIARLLGDGSIPD